MDLVRTRPSRSDVWLPPISQGTLVHTDENEHFSLKPAMPSDYLAIFPLILTELPKYYLHINYDFFLNIIQKHHAFLSFYRKLLARKPSHSLRSVYFQNLKLLLALRDTRTAELKGFTTLTFKQPCLIKFGPSMILPEYRNSGLYSKLIELREKFVFKHFSPAKLYMTTPAGATVIWKTLLKHRYIIEGELQDQYMPGVTEFILSKTLKHGPCPSIYNAPPQSPRNKTSSILKSTLGPSKWIKIIPKRGGSTKINLNTNPDLSLDSLAETLLQVESLLSKSGARKIYIHSQNSHHLFDMLLDIHYRLEGIVSHPSLENGLLILSKLLR